ncbi:unnamed protein product [Heterobilharzia americana]|nr:unnamed protein product [Heterobilharzia americana]
MLIFLRGLSGAVTPLHVNPHENILSVKIRMFYLKSIPVQDQHLLYAGVELTDNTILSTVNIGHGALLRLVLGLRSGPLGRYHFCKSSTVINQNDESLQQTSTTDEAQSLSPVSSTSCSSSSSSSPTSTSTIGFPLICVTPAVNVTNCRSSNTLEKTGTDAFLTSSSESYNNISDDNTNDSHQTSDDEINQIAEFLGYAIDESEHLLHPAYDCTAVSSENQTYGVYHDYNEEAHYYHHDHHLYIPQHFRWLITPSYNFAQRLNMLETDSYDSSENIDSKNSSKCFHGLTTVEAPSERCQSTGSLFTSGTSTMSAASGTIHLNSPLCQFKFNPQSGLRVPYSSSPNVNCTDISSNVIIENDRNIHISSEVKNNRLSHVCSGDVESNIHRSSPNIPLPNTETLISSSLDRSNPTAATTISTTSNSLINDLTRLHNHSLTFLSSHHSSYLSMQMKYSGVGGWVSSPSLTNDSSVKLRIITLSSSSGGSNDANNSNNTNAGKLCNSVLCNTVVTEDLHHTNRNGCGLPPPSSLRLHNNQVCRVQLHSNHCHQEHIITADSLLDNDNDHNNSQQIEHIELTANCNDDLQRSLSSISNTTETLSPLSHSSSSSSSSSYCSTAHSNKSRCYECNKRTRLACGFTCRCERWFCAKHHHPEDHRCNFNFKTMVNST